MDRPSFTLSPSSSSFGVPSTVLNLCWHHRRERTFFGAKDEASSGSHGATSGIWQQIQTVKSLIHGRRCRQKEITTSVGFYWWGRRGGGVRFSEKMRVVLKTRKRLLHVGKTARCSSFWSLDEDSYLLNGRAGQSGHLLAVRERYDHPSARPKIKPSVGVSSAVPS